MSLYQEPPPEAGSNLTQAVDILAFVEAQEIPPDYFETPYYLAPAPGGEKDYALLRETLRRTRKIGIAYVVIQARQHLAALIPYGQSLVLNTLRWNAEERRRVRPMPASGTTQLAAANASGLRGPLHGRTGTPLQQMRVTGCDGAESEDSDDWLTGNLFDSDDLMRAFLRPGLHVPIPHAGRSTTIRQPHGSARPRRLARRA